MGIVLLIFDLGRGLRELTKFLAVLRLCRMKRQ